MTGVIQLLEDVGTPAVKIFTLLGQIYARGSANKQGALELLFQRADDVAQALLRDVESFSRISQIHIFANFTKIIEFFYIHRVSPSI